MTQNTIYFCELNDINDIENIQTHAQNLSQQSFTVQDAKRFAYKHLKNAFWSQKIFHGHGFLDALAEAHELSLATAGLNYQDVEEMPEFWQTKLTKTELHFLLEALRQRIELKKPLPYLTNRSYLQGLEFYIDERALIPRSFIAELLEQRGLDYFLEESFNQEMSDSHDSDDSDNFKILELCTGSGCLAILAAATFEDATVQAIDISKDALAVAHINHQKYQQLDPELANRVSFYASDLYENVEGKFDVIITNPPYVCQASMDVLPAEYRHEPNLALAGGDDGMDLVEKIIKQAAFHLKATGFLIVEIGNEYNHAMALFKRLGLENVLWLEVSAGDQQVFLIHAADLLKI